MKLTNLFTLICLFTLSLTCHAELFLNKATVILKEGTTSQYLQAAEEFAVFEKTREETGNIKYQLYQKSDASNILIFEEQWKNKEALDAHLATPHMSNFFKKINLDFGLYEMRLDGNKVIFELSVESPKSLIKTLILDGFYVQRIK